MSTKDITKNDLRSTFKAYDLIFLESNYCRIKNDFKSN